MGSNHRKSHPPSNSVPTLTYLLKVLPNQTWVHLPTTQQSQFIDPGLWWRNVQHLFTGPQASSMGGSGSKDPKSLFYFTLILWKCFLLLAFFPPHHAASRISQPGTEPMLPAEEVRGLIHWTTREVWGGFLKTAFGLRDTGTMTCSDWLVVTVWLGESYSSIFWFQLVWGLYTKLVVYHPSSDRVGAVRACRTAQRYTSDCSVYPLRKSSDSVSRRNNHLYFS